MRNQSSLLKQFEKRLESRNCSAELVCRSCQRLSRSRSKFRRRTNHPWCSGRSPLELDLPEAAQRHHGASLFTCILYYGSSLAQLDAAASLRYLTMQLAALVADTRTAPVTG